MVRSAMFAAPILECVFFALSSLLVGDERIKKPLVILALAALSVATWSARSSTDETFAAPSQSSHACEDELVAENMIRATDSVGTLAAVATVLARQRCPARDFDVYQAEELARPYSRRLLARTVDSAVGDVIAFANEIVDQVCDGICVPSAQPLHPRDPLSQVDLATIP